MDTQSIKNMMPKLLDCVKKHSPEFLTVAGMVGAIGTIYNVGMGNRTRIYKALYQATGSEYYKIRYMQLTHSNNWLKMHGYPMKRKLR